MDTSGVSITPTNYKRRHQSIPSGHRSRAAQAPAWREPSKEKAVLFSSFLPSLIHCRQLSLFDLDFDLEFDAADANKLAEKLKEQATLLQEEDPRREEHQRLREPSFNDWCNQNPNSIAGITPVKES